MPAKHNMQEKAGNVSQPNARRRPAAQELFSHLGIALLLRDPDEQRDRLSKRVLNLLFGAALDRDIKREADRLPLARTTLREADERPDAQILAFHLASNPNPLPISRLASLFQRL
jgi:hypothetical protein